MAQDAIAILGKARSLPRIYEVEKDAQRRMDETIRMLCDEGDMGQSECRRGCAWCCHIQVSLLPSTLLYIAEYLRNRFPVKELKAIRSRTETLARAKRAMTRRECDFTNIACPFLMNETCIIYPVRPVQCRGHYSSSEKLCRIGYEDPENAPDIPVYGLPHVFAVGLDSGISAVLNTMGLPSAPLELISALRIILERPDAGVRWLAGEDVFEPARLEHWKEELVVRTPGGEITLPSSDCVDN